MSGALSPSAVGEPHALTVSLCRQQRQRDIAIDADAAGRIAALWTRSGPCTVPIDELGTTGWRDANTRSAPTGLGFFLLFDSIGGCGSLGGGRSPSGRVLALRLGYLRFRWSGFEADRFGRV